ncbi:transcriptional attenuator, LytR family [Natronincola peptidivorans]|uniref:Transcriptional attenuator, LytR family n=1 Tax=Natronincola peptidivorans TaxID=426128 RepID=A0A1H9YYV4_9FIRM|nr:LCP family protein [Natronincola peptidivorans]SES74400.1 transcriptional attenuator, LytR family [Natronincola peptidivorans]
MKKRRINLFGIFIIPIMIMSIIGILSMNNENNSRDRTNILIFGIDGLETSNGKGTRADSIMLFSVDHNGGHPVLISIPRDTRVIIPGRKSLDKINHAHAYGETELLIDTVEELFKMPIHYYTKISYKAVEELVDTLGGIELNVPIDMKYKDPYANPPLVIDINKGTQTLKGTEALHFLRFRSGYPNQDLGRIAAQQQFVNALVEEIISPTNLLRAPTIAKTFLNNVDTNISKGNILYLAYKGFISKPNELLRVTIPGSSKMIHGISYYIVEDEDIANVKKQYLNPSKALATNIKIEVLNGCGVNGVAARVAEKLEDHSIAVSEIGNYEVNNLQQSFIEYESKHKKDAKKISKLLSIKKLIEREDEASTSNITIIIGRDLEF